MSVHAMARPLVVRRVVPNQTRPWSSNPTRCQPSPCVTTWICLRPSIGYLRAEVGLGWEHSAARATRAFHLPEEQDHDRAVTPARPCQWRRRRLARRRAGATVTRPRPGASRAAASGMPGVRGRGGRGGGLRRGHLDAERDMPGLTGLERPDVHHAAGDELAPVLSHLDDHGIFGGGGVGGVPDSALDVERAQGGPDDWTGAGDGVEAQVAPAGRARDRAAQDTLSAVWALPRLAHHGGGHSAGRELRGVLQWPGLAFTLLPPELHLAPHLGSGGDHHAARLHVSDQRAGAHELSPRRRDNLAADIPGDQDRIGRDLALDKGAGLDGQLAIHLDRALEPTDHTEVAGALDLSFDREAGGQNGFAIVHTGVGHLRALLWSGIGNQERRA